MGSMPVKRGDEYEVKILDKIAAKGRGIARLNDFVIFVKNGVPGQKVKIKIVRLRSNFAEAKVMELLEKSDIETDAKCPHFGKCGGCVWQNLEYTKQLELKQKQVYETLQHLGKVKKFDLLPIIPSPKIWEYRNKIEMSFGYGNMWVEKQDEKITYHDDDPCLGFHASEKWEQIVKIKRCYLFNSKIEQVLDIFNTAIEKSLFNVYNPKTHKGFLRQLIVRSTNETEELLINIVVNPIDKNYSKRTSHENKKLLYATKFGNVLKELVKIAGVQGILVTESSNLNDSLNNPTAELIWGKDCIYEKLGYLKFKISPFSFFQTNTEGAGKLYHKILEFVDLKPKKRILDLYCGTGAIGLYLAKKASYIYGFDINPYAISDAKENAKLNDIGNIEFICGAIEKELRTLNSIIKDCRISDIVVDPPRAGMHKNVITAIAKSDIKKIIYVSCNPATLARDIEKLTFYGFVLERVQPVDMFPHTAHVETVAELVRKK